MWPDPSGCTRRRQLIMLARRSLRTLRAAVAHSPVAVAVPARTYVAPRNEMDFVFHEVHKMPAHYAKLRNFAECDKDTMDMVVDATAQLCEQELSPLTMTSDRNGCVWVDENTIKSPAGFKEAYNMYKDAGWQGLSYPEEWGGQNLPMSMALLQSEMMAGANFTFTMFPGLSKGAINTILMHATQELKEKYLPQMVSGQFTGTMCLTEPGCGSDLGQVITKAERIGDGSYKISGTKIFISCGDHDLSDNVIHCVLARLTDAPPAAASPAGTRGISLFLVPKFLPDGSRNGVTVSRIEDKMGCHGSPTCQMEFDGAKGWLLGTENKGMGHMFTFINTSRIGTAAQGAAAAENALQNSLWYCKERTSMRALSGTKAPEKIADPIINHPALRNMLFTMKAYSEGGRSMIFECAMLADKMLDLEYDSKKCLAKGDKAGSEAALKAAAVIDERMGFLTPILKGFLTEAGKEAADMGIQVYGGHGYIKDNKAEQVYRDVRIAPVWEGTTQIQALDLLGRKIMRQKLKPINEHCAELRALCKPHLFSGNAALRTHAWTLLKHSIEWQWLTVRVAKRGLSDRESVGVAAEPYLMFSGHVTLAAHWLNMEAIALEKIAALEAGAKAGEANAPMKEINFYKAKLATSAFVFDVLLPRTRSLKRGILTPAASLMSLHQDHFSFDHAR